MRSENHNSNDKHNVTPRRKKIAFTHMTRREALETLNVCEGCPENEIRRKHKTLARKCHPDKWNERCAFTKEESEIVFKNLSNAREKLMRG